MDDKNGSLSFSDIIVFAATTYILYRIVTAYL